MSPEEQCDLGVANLQQPFERTMLLDFVHDGLHLLKWQIMIT